MVYSNVSRSVVKMSTFGVVDRVSTREVTQFTDKPNVLSRDTYCHFKQNVSMIVYVPRSGVVSWKTYFPIVKWGIVESFTFNTSWGPQLTRLEYTMSLGDI